VHKVGKTLANRVVERRNMINDYLRGTTCIEFVRESLNQGEFLSLSFSYSFCFVFEFLYLFFAILLCLPFFVPFAGSAVFLLLDDILELFFAFRSFSCASWVLDSKFKLYVFCY
jgi:hypothetical protein